MVFGSCGSFQNKDFDLSSEEKSFSEFSHCKMQKLNACIDTTGFSPSQSLLNITRIIKILAGECCNNDKMRNISMAKRMRKFEL